MPHRLSVRQPAVTTYTPRSASRRPGIAIYQVTQALQGSSVAGCAAECCPALLLLPRLFQYAPRPPSSSSTLLSDVPRPHPHPPSSSTFSSTHPSHPVSSSLTLPSCSPHSHSAPFFFNTIHLCLIPSSLLSKLCQLLTTFSFHTLFHLQHLAPFACISHPPSSSWTPSSTCASRPLLSSI